MRGNSAGSVSFVQLSQVNISTSPTGSPTYWVENTPPRHPRQAGGVVENPQLYGRASKTMLNGVSVARRKRVNPADVTTSRSLASPACAPNPSPTSWSSDAGTHTSVEAE